MIRRLITIVCLVLCTFFVGIALVTFSPYDIGWTYDDTYTDCVYANGAGKAGACCASFLVFFLGSGAWLLIPLLLKMAFSLGTRQAFSKGCNFYCGMTLLLLATATWCAHQKCDYFSGVSAGGLVGNALAHLIMKLYDPFLEQQLLLCWFFIALLLITGCVWVSWLRIYDGALKTIKYTHFYRVTCFTHWIVQNIDRCSLFITKCLQPRQSSSYDALEKWIQDL